MIQCIDGKKFRDMFVSGANNLQNNKDLVDKLNVFPVPDGDLQECIWLFFMQR